MSNHYRCSIGEWIKRAIILILYVAVAALIGYLLLVAAYCIPADWMSDHVAESTEQFAAETHPYNIADNPIDNLTDAYMMLAAAHENIESPWQAAADVMISEHDGEMPNYAFVSIYRDGAEPDSEFSYARYWHGYLIVLKPLLCLLNYGQIRYLMAVCQLILLFGVLSLIQRRHGTSYALALLAAYLLLNPITTMVCMQYNVIALLTLVFLLVLMVRADYWLSHAWQTAFLFCTYGLLTSYIDLLTYPIVTLGLPLLTLGSIYIHDHKDGLACQIVQNSVAWGLGYLGMWALKWIYGSIVLGRELLSEALYNAEMRTASSVNGSEGTITYINVIKVNVSEISVVAIVAFVIILMMILLRGRYIRGLKEWQDGLGLLVIAIYPLLWYAVFKNHSYVHGWFTYRDLAVGGYGVLLFAAFIKEHN